MLLYKAFRWVQPLQELTSSEHFWIKSWCFFWCLILDVISRDFSAAWCQNYRFWEPLGAQLAPKWHTKSPKWCQIGEENHTWCSHFPFLDFLASKRYIRASATLHSGQCNVALGPFWDDFCNDMLLDLGWFFNEISLMEYARKHSSAPPSIPLPPSLPPPSPPPRRA